MDKKNKDPFSLGNEKEFREIYNRYASSIRYFAGKYLDDDNLIDDTVQETFINLWENRISFNSENSIKAYLYRVVKNKCLNIIRHQNVREKYNDFTQKENEIEDSFLENLFETELFQALLDVFEQLPPACKNVYLMSLDGKTHEEISKELGISVNTIKSHKNFANNFMKEKMKNIISIILLSL